MIRVKKCFSLAILVFSVVGLFVVGCGGAGDGATKTPSPVWTSAPPIDTPFPTSTPTPLLPDFSTVTLQPAEQLAMNCHVPDGLYLGDVSTGRTFGVVTAPGPVLDPWSWISPTQLVLSSWRSDGFYLLDLDADTLRLLPPKADNIAVSFSHASGLMTYQGQDGSLVVAAINDNTIMTRITPGPRAPQYAAAYVNWSPDDTHIYYRTNDIGGAVIASVVPNPVAIPIQMPSSTSAIEWLPDSSGIVFVDSEGVLSANATTGEISRLYSWPSGVVDTPYLESLSPDGKYALITEVTHAGLVIPLAGTADGFRVTNIEGVDAGWLPDDSLAFVADRCTPDARFLVVDLSGEIDRTFDEGAMMPRSSPDRRFLAYSGCEPAEEGLDRKCGIVLRSTSGSNDFMSLLPYIADDSWWSPDGRWIADSFSDLPSPEANSCIEGLPKTEILPLP